VIATAILDSILDATGTRRWFVSHASDAICRRAARKCEFMNPGGSCKDRIGVRMLLEAEKSGRISRAIR